MTSFCRKNTDNRKFFEDKDLKDVAILTKSEKTEKFKPRFTIAAKSCGPVIANGGKFTLRCRLPFRR